MTRKVSGSGQEMVSISCKDQGAGLSKANLKLLFGEGVQFNANELQAGGGSGFGLYITKGIVLLHKGANIWAESEGEGKGCTFFVELPLVVITDPENHLNDDDNSSVHDRDREAPVAPLKQEDSRLVSVQSDPSKASSAFALAAYKPKVLIVDDSAMNRRMLLHMLEAEGFECFQAVDGLAAVAYVTRAGLFTSAPAILITENPSKASVGLEDAEEGSGTESGAGTRMAQAVGSSPVRRLPSEHRQEGNISAHGRAKGTGSGSRLSTEDQPLVPFRKMGSRHSGASAANRRLAAPSGTCSHDPPDVILMDSNMPKMNGPDAIAEIRKLGFKSLIMGVTGDEDHASFMRAGADGVMMKPVKADELVKVIRAALRNQQQSQR